LEHLGVAANGNSASALHEYATEALHNSSEFYSCPPSADYEFSDGLLKFSSAIQTPYAENNTVYGRVFDSGKDLAVVVLPQWNCKWDGQVKLCRILQRAGITALRLSLPYHHH